MGNHTGRHQGFTLIELIISLAIIVPVLLGAIGLNVYVFRMNETSRRAVVALQDAHTVIERIRNLSETSLAQVTSTYPSGQTVSGFSNLPSEQVTVTYPNASTDPLVITVTASWVDRQGAMNRSLATQVTHR